MHLLNFSFFRLYLFVLPLIMFLPIHGEESSEDKTVLLAILARNKEHTLPHFLNCIDNLEYDKKKIVVYINTNNNQDSTKELLESWVKKNEKEYALVEFETHEIDEMESTRPHEWTAERFKTLGTIRNKSLQKTKEHQCDFYFVVDCDNFIIPCTLRDLVSKDKPIIAPMLYAIPERGDTYSNYFNHISDTGYCLSHPDYFKILAREMVGTLEMPVVHCTYLIKSEYIDRLNYIDDTNDYEFVIFSRNARKNGVGQYLCNEKDFGYLIHFFDDITLEEEAQRVRALPQLHLGSSAP